MNCCPAIGVPISRGIVRPLRRLFALVFALLVPSTAAAQTADGGPDPAQVHVRIGSLWMKPTIAIPNIGIDTNVFNEPESADPKEDLTVTVTPRAELWLPLGRTWLSGVIHEDIVWYEEYTAERSSNGRYIAAWKASLNRVVLSTDATWLRTSARPGFEIDARARRKEPAYAASAEIRALTRTLFGVRGRWGSVSFDDDAEFNGTNLKEELDRRSVSAAVTVRHELTPLTSVTFSASRSDENFAFATSRDSTSDNYSVSFTFDPAALLKGSAMFGFTDYKPESADLPGFEGATFEVNLTYTFLGATRLAGTVRRDIEFSYDDSQPYYLFTGGTVSIAQQIFGPVDVVGRAGAQWLEYRTRAGASVASPDRTDRVRSYGAGAGFRLSEDLRLGFDIDRDRRTSVLPDREYSGLKYGASLTYGL
jgi:hypothetical protein